MKLIFFRNYDKGSSRLVISNQLRYEATYLFVEKKYYQKQNNYKKKKCFCYNELSMDWPLNIWKMSKTSLREQSEVFCPLFTWGHQYNCCITTNIFAKAYQRILHICQQDYACWIDLQQCIRLNLVAPLVIPIANLVARVSLIVSHWVGTFQTTEACS